MIEALALTYLLLHAVSLLPGVDVTTAKGQVNWSNPGPYIAMIAGVAGIVLAIAVLL